MMNRAQIIKKCKEILKMSDSEVRHFENIVETSSAPLEVRRQLMKAIDKRMGRIQHQDNSVLVVDGDIDDMLV